MIIENKVLTIEDVKKLNESSDSDNLVRIYNTKDQNPQIIAQLSKNVKIQVLGGYAHKQYVNTKYRDRTYYSPQHISDIINVYQQIENNIDDKWTELEKVFYLYTTITLYLNYDMQTFLNSEWEKDKIVEPFGAEKNITSAGKLFRNKLYFSFLKKEDIPSTYRNLCCMLTRSAHCAGFANCLKESLDRMGIKNNLLHYDNLHTANIVYLDKRKILFDPTFESTDLYVNIVKRKKLALTKNFGKYASENDYLKDNFYETFNLVLKKNVSNLKFNKVSKIEKWFLNNKILPKSIETVISIVTPTFEEEKPININVKQAPTLKIFKATPEK